MKSKCTPHPMTIKTNLHFGNWWGCATAKEKSHDPLWGQVEFEVKNCQKVSVPANMSCH